MMDVITLQDRGRYKQEEYLQQAAHERVLRQLRPARTGAPVTRPARLGQVGSLLVGTAVLLAAVALRPAAAPVQAAVPMSVIASTGAPALAPTRGSDCWITGDLVGDANPAVIAASFCGY
ncbi:MAG: hypothetical protein M3336_06665 [Chloroflexota bacterium]|nr:hypothetical protein [Chloroflexota bacterium]